MRATKSRGPVCGALLVVALLAACHGAARPRVGRPERGSTVASTPPAPPPGAALYRRYCALCHGQDGTGYAADNATSLVNPTFLASASDEFLRAGIGRGRPGTPMAGYRRAVGGPLTDAEIDQIISFLRARGPGLATLPAPLAGDLRRGVGLYMRNCFGCHGGSGIRGTYVHLANPNLMSSASDAFLRYAIAEGRPGTAMQAWRGRLDEQQIADVIAAMRTWPSTPLPDPRTVQVPDVPLVVHPDGRPPRFTLREDRFVSIAQVKRALDQGRRIILADARPPSDWLRGHIPGAVSMPYHNLSRLDLLHDDGTWVVAYCGCPHHASGVIVDELRRRGFRHTAVLDEGYFVWQRAGYPAIDVDGGPAVPPPAARPPGGAPPNAVPDLGPAPGGPAPAPGGPAPAPGGPAPAPGGPTPAPGASPAR